MPDRIRDVQQLHDRLILFGVAVCKSLEKLRRDRITDHFAMQLIRSATSPAAHYGEARAAESRRDFIHKLQICLKELRESDVWLRYLSALRDLDCTSLRSECNELVAIIVASLKTARRNDS
jgi:four helix bundle protein